MKKLLCLLLIFLFCLSGAIAAEPELNLLWDIPFGTEETDFVRMVEEASGIVLEVIGHNPATSWTVYGKSENQPISILGASLSRFSADVRGIRELPDGSTVIVDPPQYCNVEMVFVEFTGDSVADGLEQFLMLSDALSEKYGPPDFEYYMTRSENLVDIYHELHLPVREIDWDSIRMKETDSRVVFFDLVYGNIRLFATINNKSGSWYNNLFFLDHIVEQPEYVIDEPEKTPAPVDVGL